MKNLVNQFRKGAPLKSAKLAKEERIKYDWDRRHNSTYHPVDGVWPWKRVKRICEAFIGKPFADAFSKYCAEVPVYQQNIFLEEFNNRGRRNSDYWNYYFVDKQGNIQKHIGEYFIKKAKDRKVYYYSDDYKTEMRHKTTGESMPEYWFRRKGKYAEENYVSTVVSGYFLEFKSEKDHEYIRLISDQRKRKKAAARLAEKEKAAKAYSFISNSEKELKKEKALNRVKIEAKGFDYETSFRDAGINPDTIKEHQGFA
jgi:hypothetical protein